MRGANETYVRCAVLAAAKQKLVSPLIKVKEMYVYPIGMTSIYSVIVKQMAFAHFCCSSLNVEFFQKINLTIK